LSRQRRQYASQRLDFNITADADHNPARKVDVDVDCEASGDAATAPDAIRTGTKPLSPAWLPIAGANSCRRQVKSWPGAIPCVRATCDAVRSGRADSATIRSFSSRLQRRHRSTDVITSTVVIVLCLLSQ
jgi:hypothetical protein